MALAWTDALSVGVNIIDKQHQDLIAKTNALTHAISSGINRMEIGKLIDYLEEYAVWHFSIEEQYMRKYFYSGYKRHIDEHAYFIEGVQTWKQRLESDTQANEQATTLQERLCEWIINHIFIEDKQFGAFLKDKM